MSKKSKPARLGFVALCLCLTGCVSTGSSGSREEYLGLLAMQAGPILQVNSALKEGKKPSFDEARESMQQINSCLEQMPTILNAGKEDDGKAYVSLADNIPVANGPIKVSGYYKLCQSLLKRMSRMEFASCQQRELEMRSVGKRGEFGAFAVYSAEPACKEKRSCYENMLQKPEALRPLPSCGDNVAEFIPVLFKSDEKKLRKVCGKGSLIIFGDGGEKNEAHRFDPLLATKTYPFRCYKVVARSKPFVKEIARLNTMKVKHPALYKILSE